MTARAEVVFGFRRTDRLRKTDEFSSVFAFRRRVRGAHFELAYRPADKDREPARTRLGVVVGKRQAPSAVMRNGIKRLAREAFRHVRGQLPPHDIVIRLTRRLESLDKQTLRRELDELMRSLVK